MSGAARPLIVALEASSALGSVALAAGGQVLARAFLERRGRHAAEMVPALAGVLGEAGAEREAVGEIVVGAGPGSFTGVRVAAAMAKGLARALDVPLFAHSSLAAAAVAEWAIPRWQGRRPAAPDGEGGLRWILFDARGDRLYGGCYEVSGTSFEVVRPPEALRLADVLATPATPDLWLAGDGAVRHEPRLRAAGHRVLPAPAGIPTADGLVRLRALLEDRGRVDDPGRWEPDYLRGSTPGATG